MKTRRMPGALRQTAELFFDTFYAHGGRTMYLSPEEIDADAYDALCDVMPLPHFVVDRPGHPNAKPRDGIDHRTFALLLAAEVLENPA